MTMAMNMDKMRGAKKAEDKREKRSKFSPDDLVGDGYDGDTVGVCYESIEHVTEKASLLVIDGEKVWVPKSMVTEADDEAIIVSKWWADKQGIEGL